MRPIPHESTASYVNRLAHAYRTTTAHLLDALGIALTHPSSSRAGDGAGTAELHLDTAAQHRLAVFARTPLDDLRQALPHLAADPPTTSPPTLAPVPVLAAPRQPASHRCPPVSGNGSNPANTPSWHAPPAPCATPKERPAAPTSTRPRTRPCVRATGTGAWTRTTT
ncbi:TniQ family protein [Kitasatospora sp. NPDC058218]|uniref:TniQ family protein n=1 Tax=Kitasatospora sp. NPDC058218 TaxID=3346385 RepID=UPI0036DCA6A7